jgi:hypothetical protein
MAETHQCVDRSHAVPSSGEKSLYHVCNGLLSLFIIMDVGFGHLGTNLPVTGETLPCKGSALPPGRCCWGRTTRDH